MGLYFRRSVRFGPLRVNFSKSGVGLSAGVRGLRVGTGPRGNYIHAGARGVYYRAALPGPAVRRRVAPRPAPAAVPSPVPAGTDGSLEAFKSIASAEAAQMSDCSSDSLLDEIRTKHQRIRFWPWMAALGAIEILVSWNHGLPGWVTGILALGCAVTTLFVFRWDVRRKLTIVHYDLEAAAEQALAQLVGAAAKLRQCRGLWHLTGQAVVRDGKYHAGAATTVRRGKALVAERLPPYVVANLNPIAVSLSKISLYFFPDRVLVYQGKRVGAVSYGALRCTGSDVRFIEDGAPPSDTEVVGRTWRYVNKSGGPDRRFKDNRQLPVCRYGEVSLASDSGLNEVLQLSNAALVAEFVSAVEGLRR